VRASLFGFALARTLATVRGVSIGPRIWTSFGRIRGAMTCNARAMLGRGVDLESYYAVICHGRDSEDWFEPRLVAADLEAALDLGPLQAYAAAGARHDRTRFDIGVRRPGGGRDPDHPILEVRFTRPQFALGASWHAAARWSAGAEAFYAPGSLLTARLSVHYLVRQ
jgi:hypothetical protein